MRADHRARSGFRASDLVAHYRPAPGPHRAGRSRGRGRRCAPGARDLHRPADLRRQRGDRVTAALELTGVTSGYGSSPVVQGVSLQVAPGEIVALVGKNGMGKSSLLKTILAFLPVWDGTVRIDGRDVTGLAPHRMRALG